MDIRLTDEQFKLLLKHEEFLTKMSNLILSKIMHAPRYGVGAEFYEVKQKLIAELTRRVALPKKELAQIHQEVKTEYGKTVRQEMDKIIRSMIGKLFGNTLAQVIKENSSSEWGGVKGGQNTPPIEAPTQRPPGVKG